MLNKIKKLLIAPHPFLFGWSDVLIPSFIVFFLLLVMAPFGLADMTFIDRFFVVLLFEGITAGSVIFHYAIFLKFVSVNKEAWTMGKELLYNISDMLLIGFWNSLFVAIIRDNSIEFLPILVRVELHTFLIGSIPVFILILYKNNKALKEEVAKATSTNQVLQNQSKPNSGIQQEKNTITLLDENNKAELTLLPNELLFLHSEGNYIEVYFLQQSGFVKKHLLRNRLKEVINMLPSNFLQCHRSYIINTDKIMKAEGNAREMQLYLRGVTAPVPVSRSKTNVLLKQLEMHSKAS